MLPAKPAASRLLGIFFAQFHNIKGPEVVFQAPAGLLRPEVFAPLSDYVIVEKELCGRVVSVCSAAPLGLVVDGAQERGFKLMGFPVRLEGKKYGRNALLFNIGFVLRPAGLGKNDDEEDVRPDDEPWGVVDDGDALGPARDEDALFEPALRKLGTFFSGLETESGFLSNPASRSRLADLLPRILHALRATGRVVLPVDESNALALALQPHYGAPVPPPVEDHDVPVPLCDLLALADPVANAAAMAALRAATALQTPQGHRQGMGVGGGTSDADPATGMALDGGTRVIIDDLCWRRCAPLIDGVRFVRRIAIEANMAACLQCMLYFGLVRLSPGHIFFYTNIYAVTPRIAVLASPKSLRLQREAVLYVTKHHDAPSSAPSPSQLPVTTSSSSSSLSSSSSSTSGGRRGKSKARSNRTRPSFAKIVAVYSSMRGQATIGELTETLQLGMLNIDERRLVAFGLMHGIIRRVRARDAYPVAPLDRRTAPAAQVANHRVLSAAPSPGQGGVSVRTAASARAPRRVFAGTPHAHGGRSDESRHRRGPHANVAPPSLASAAPALATSIGIQGQGPKSLVAQATPSVRIPGSAGRVPASNNRTSSQAVPVGRTRRDVAGREATARAGGRTSSIILSSSMPSLDNMNMHMLRRKGGSARPGTGQQMPPQAQAPRATSLGPNVEAEGGTNGNGNSNSGTGGTGIMRTEIGGELAVSVARVRSRLRSGSERSEGSASSEASGASGAARHRRESSGSLSAASLPPPASLSGPSSVLAPLHTVSSAPSLASSATAAGGAPLAPSHPTSRASGVSTPLPTRASAREREAAAAAAAVATGEEVPASQTSPPSVNLGRGMTRADAATVVSYFDGSRDMDQICVATMRSVAEISRLIDRDPSCVVVYK